MIKEDELEEFICASVNVPQGFHVHPRLQKMHMESRLRLFKESKRVDWATAEAICFASLLKEGYKVRLSGQDVGRGTFSHRHAILYDQVTNASCIPLHSISKNLEIIDSPLSELAVLGFEYGQSVVEVDDKLVIWEAQFGDFFNGAQTIIDTFIVSGEQKWGLQTGLVLLLPHGFNGAGPEHSSSRIERFLQQSDEPVDQSAVSPEMGINIQVTQPSTPANYFHLLRRQLKRIHRKPLIIASPKQLLRLPAAQSDVSALCHESFQPILFDKEKLLSSKCCLFTSGEMAYELEKEFPSDVLIVRLEQLCPFPKGDLQRLLSKTSADTFVYCQPEPENMGAWKYVRERLEPMLSKRLLHYAGRKASAAPATGYTMQHSIEHQDILKRLYELMATNK